MVKLYCKLVVSIWFYTLIIFPKEIISSSSAVNSKFTNKNGLTKTYNECGGYVEARLNHKVILEYKPDEEYENDEYCIWEVRNVDCYKTLYTKFKSGFEVGQDYLQISTFMQTHIYPTHLFIGNISGIEQANGYGPVGFVIFSSDDSIRGMGFRMEIVGYSARGLPYVFDDFITAEPTGSLTLRPYVHHMIYSYLIIPEYKTVPSLVLDVEYLTNWYDWLSVFSIERNGSSINFHRHAQVLRGNGSDSFESVYHSNFVVFFKSDNNPIPENSGYTLSWHVPENKV